MQDMVAIVLAAGKGTRMKSNLPKVMHRAGGKTLVQHVIDSVKSAGIFQVVVVIGCGAELVKTSLGDTYRYVVQTDQLGTGHAVQQAGPVIAAEEATVLVLCGDMPLISANSLTKLMQRHRENNAAATVLTAYFADPTGYGRILRDAQGRLERIVEEKDASPEVKRLKEVNTGTYCFNRDELFSALEEIEPNNVQGEYYLTDVLTIMLNKGLTVEIVDEAEAQEALGINSRQQLAEAEQIFRQRTLERVMAEGVTVIDPGSTFIDDSAEIAPDTIIHPFTIIAGQSRIGPESEIGPFTRIKDSIVGKKVLVQNSVIIESYVGDNCNIGPFAYLRPETHLESGVKVGDFVELKKSWVGKGTKIPHLSYVGDATVGSGVNVGCGTITCNYDGVNKYQTIIEDGAFIGSNTNLVAPVKIGSGATVGAGSTITKDVPEDALAVERSQQKAINNWHKRKSCLKGDA